VYISLHLLLDMHLGYKCVDDERHIDVKGRLWTD